jgi:4'-phosphopantetheinyl transferase EntD
MIAELLGPTVVTAEVFHDVPDERCFPGEENLIVHAVESRRREFITARRCAREALRGLGFPPVPIGTGPKREPQWPAGVVGSITHCAGYRAAVVARLTDVAALGIDAEPHEPLPAGVGDVVITPGEAAMLDRLSRSDPGTHWDRLLFSAKESVYKAWFPLTRRWLEFHDAKLSINPATARFTAQLTVNGAGVGWSPAAVSGRYLIARGLILTAVCLEPASILPAEHARPDRGKLQTSLRLLSN